MKADAGEGLGCQAQLYRRGSTPEEGESRERAEAVEGDDEEGAVDPVSEKRRQEEKGKVATQDCNMAVVVFLSQTAVILTKRSSSHSRGVRLESPNLSAALLDLVAYGRPGLHSAAIVMSVYRRSILVSVLYSQRPSS